MAGNAVTGKVMPKLYASYATAEHEDSQGEIGILAIIPGNKVPTLPHLFSLLET